MSEAKHTPECLVNELIEAAPDLLKFAQLFVEVHNPQLNTTGHHCCHCIFCRVAKAAIAKATGESREA